jgi:GrpB-like predicted nucleotidyltransferase (UPF0157 family)
MPPDITAAKLVDSDPEGVQRVSRRPLKVIEIVEYQDSWQQDFAVISSQIRAALGERSLSIDHIGSTSVPGLPAKDIIDVNLIVDDATDEDAYIPALERAGFQFLFREPNWHQHRFLGLEKPYANIHVFGKDSTEPAKMLVFRDYLREHEDEQALYARAKRDAAEASRLGGETVMQYNGRKEKVVREILQRAFKAHGLLE